MVLSSILIRNGVKYLLSEDTEVRFGSKDLLQTSIEQVFDPAQHPIGESAEVQFSWQVLPRQSVGILAAVALSSRVLIGKVDLRL